MYHHLMQYDFGALQILTITLVFPDRFLSFFTIGNRNECCTKNKVGFFIETWCMYLCTCCHISVVCSVLICIYPVCNIAGDDGTSAEVQSTGGLMKEAENIYTLWCTGRTYCEGMLVTLKLLKRQDLVSSIARLVRPVCDQIVSGCNYS